MYRDKVVKEQIDAMMDKHVSLPPAWIPTIKAALMVAWDRGHSEGHSEGWDEGYSEGFAAADDR